MFFQGKLQIFVENYQNFVENYQNFVENYQNFVENYQNFCRKLSKTGKKKTRKGIYCIVSLIFYLNNEITSFLINTSGSRPPDLSWSRTSFSGGVSRTSFSKGASRSFLSGGISRLSFSRSSEFSWIGRSKSWKNQEIDHELNPKLFQGIDNDNDNGLIMIHILN